jgi:hypothetical protein
MDHLLVAGFDIGRNPSPSAALRERARRSAERLTMQRLTRNAWQSWPRSLLEVSALR